MRVVIHILEQPGLSAWSHQFVFLSSKQFCWVNDGMPNALVQRRHLTSLTQVCVYIFMKITWDQAIMSVWNKIKETDLSWPFKQREWHQLMIPKMMRFVPFLHKTGGNGQHAVSLELALKIKKGDDGIWRGCADGDCVWTMNSVPWTFASPNRNYDHPHSMFRFEVFCSFMTPQVWKLSKVETYHIFIKRQN